MTTVSQVLDELKALGVPSRLAGMARYGIVTDRAFGVVIPDLRALAKRLGRDHELARALWASGYHEARILAGMVAEPARTTDAELEVWVADFNSWDLCDQVCMNLIEKLPHAWDKAFAWSHSDVEFIKRAGYVMMARLAFTDRQSADDRFLAFLPEIRRGASDPRNFVKKAVNWALRQIGKRSHFLHRAALAEAEAIAEIDSKPARWVARDALRELNDPKTVARIKR